MGVDPDVNEHQPLFVRRGKSFVHGGIQLGRVADLDTDVAKRLHQGFEVRERVAVGTLGNTTTVQHLQPQLKQAQGDTVYIRWRLKRHSRLDCFA